MAQSPEGHSKESNFPMQVGEPGEGLSQGNERIQCIKPARCGWGLEKAPVGKNSSRDACWEIILEVRELQLSGDQHPVTFPARPNDCVFLFKSCLSLILWVLGTGPSCGPVPQHYFCRCNIYMLDVDV